MLTWKAFGKTHVGHVRSRNEDAFVVQEESLLCVVCDGVGGGKAGDVASALAVASVVESLASATEGSAKERLTKAIVWANARVYEQGREGATKDMASTIVALYVHKEGLAIAHVGDSRIYRFREGVLTCLTRDHNGLTEAEDLIRQHEASGNAAPDYLNKFTTSPMAAFLTRCLGDQATVKVDGLDIVPQSGDLYLLCSDGLTGMVADEVIGELLALAGTHHLKTAVHVLIQAALAAGGVDNITVILVACEEGGD